MPRFVPPLIVAVVAFVPFIPALDGEWLGWDDADMFLKHDRWRGLGPSNVAWMFSHFTMGHYHPVTWLTFGLDHAFWGLYPQGFHFTNLVMHSVAAVLLYYVALALLQLRGAPPARLLCAGVAVLWAVNPLRVESVAWITERRDLVSTVFYLATLLFHLRMIRDREHRTRWYVLSLVAFMLSLLSKAWGMTLPVVLLAADFWVLGRFADLHERRRALLEKIPFFILAFACAVLASSAQRTVGAAISFEHHSMGERIFQAAYGLLFYPRKTLVPTSLSPMYLIDRQLLLRDPMILGSILAAVSITAVLFAMRRRAPVLLAAWVSYAVTVAPVLGFHQSGFQLVADRYSYVAMIMLLLPLAGLHGVLTGARGRIACVVVVLVAAAWGALSWRQSHHWRSTLSLWSHAVAVEPNYYVRVALADCYNVAGRPRESIEQCDAALRTAPQFADAWSQRGLARTTLGDLAGAVVDFDRALSLQPGHFRALKGRGLARLGLRDAEGALADFDRALELKPDYVEARMARARVREHLGQLRGAADDCEWLLGSTPRDWPNRAGVHTHLMKLLHDLERRP